MSAKYECNINYIALIFSIWKIKGANISFFGMHFFKDKGCIKKNGFTKLLEVFIDHKRKSTE